MKRSFFTNISIVICLLTVISGCSLSTGCSKTSADKIPYATYDGGIISKYDFDQRILGLSENQQEDLKLVDNKIKLLEIMAKEKAFYLEGKDLKLDQDTEFKNAVTNNINPLLISKYYQKIIKSQVSVSQEKALEFYNNNQDRYTEFASADIKYMQLKDMKTAKKTLNDLNNNKKSFTELNEKINQNSYALNNKGILKNIKHNGSGYIAGIGTDTYLDSLIFSLPFKQGKFFGPFESENGIHIFAFLNRSKETVKPFKVVEKEVMNSARIDEEIKLNKQYIEDEKTKYNISIVNDVLSSIDFVNTENNSDNLVKVVSESSETSFSWTVAQFIDFINNLNRYEKAMITQSEPIDIFNHILSKKLYMFELKKEGFDKEVLNSQEVKKQMSNMLIGFTYRNLVSSKINITDEDINDYYNTHKEEYRKPGYRNIEVLEFADIEIANKALKQYRKAVKRNNEKEIERIMKKYCLNQYSRKNVQHVYHNGIVSGYGKDDTFNTAIWELPINEISDPLKTKKLGNIVIFRTIEEIPVRYKSLDDATFKNGIKGKIKKITENKLFEEKSQELFKKFNFNFFNDKLKTTLSAEELFEQANKNLQIASYPKALQYYDQIINSYPNGKDDYRAMFMKAFLQSEYMNNKHEAIATYSKLIKKFPNGEMNEDAKAMIDQLQGKTELVLPEDK